MFDASRGLLLAYIQIENGELFIDVVELSKKGSEYRYLGQVWKREHPYIFARCRNRDGEMALIKPLSRSHDPFAGREIEVKDGARQRYEAWIK